MSTGTLRYFQVWSVSCLDDKEIFAFAFNNPLKWCRLEVVARRKRVRSKGMGRQRGENKETGSIEANRRRNGMWGEKTGKKPEQRL